MYYSVFIYGPAVNRSTTVRFPTPRVKSAFIVTRSGTSLSQDVFQCVNRWLVSRARPSDELFDTKIVKSLAGEHTQLSRSIVRYTSD